MWGLRALNCILHSIWKELNEYFLTGYILIRIIPYTGYARKTVDLIQSNICNTSLTDDQLHPFLLFCLWILNGASTFEWYNYHFVSHLVLWRILSANCRELGFQVLQSGYPILFQSVAIIDWIGPLDFQQKKWPTPIQPSSSSRQLRRNRQFYQWNHREV